MGLICFAHMNGVNETLNPLTKTLIQEIQTAPEAVQREVFDFLVFFKARQTAPAEGGETCSRSPNPPGPPTGTPRRRTRHGAICKR